MPKTKFTASVHITKKKEKKEFLLGEINAIILKQHSETNHTLYQANTGGH